MASHAHTTVQATLKAHNFFPAESLSLSKRLFMTGALLASGHLGGRKEVEALIEDLIGALDNHDGDENLEESEPDEDGGDEEPSLGWTERQAARNAYSEGDLHHYWLGYDRELDTSDAEPTLGAPERHPVSWEYAPLGVVCREPGFVHHVREKSQENWADGLAGDHEREEENEHGGDILDEPHDGGEDDEHDYREL